MELITSGEQAGTWGDTTNQNWKRVEQSISKKSTVNLGGTTSTYSWELADTADADASGSEGRSAFVEFTNAGAAIIVNIRGNGPTDYPNRVFFAYNNSGYALTFDSNASSDFVLASGAAAAIYTDPGTAAGNIFNTFQVGSGAAGLVLSNGKIQALGGAVSFDDDNITNVGSIALDSIAADDGSSFAFDNNWTAASRTCANLGIVTTSGAVTLGGALTVGSAASGHDVTFESATSGDNFLWDASAKKLVITGTDSTNALEVPDGNVSITDTLTATNIGAFNLTGKLTAGSNEIEGTNFNIDGGNISAVTISGDLTWSSNQDYGSSNLVTTGTLGAGATTVSSLNVSDGNITNGGDINCDSVSVDNGAVGLNIDFRGADDGASKISFQDGHAEALIFENSSGADLIVINTESSNSITVSPATTFSAGLDVTGDLQVDNINIDGNTISSTNSGGVITIQPNGAGDINLRTDEVRLGDNGENSTLTTFGTGDLTLNTNEGTNSGSIKIFDGVNGTIDIVPNGTGNIQLFQGGGNGLLTLDGNSIDNVNYLHCQSISSESNTTDFVLHFNSNTGRNIIKLDDGKADALSIVDNSGNDYMVFDTSNDIITFSQDPTFAGRTIANLGTVSAATSITSSAFVGPLTGNVTGNASGSSGNCTGNSATATLADTVTVTDSSASSNFPVTFHNESTDALHDDTGTFTYNPSSGILSMPVISAATSIVAPIISATTLNGTLSTSAQPNITTVGNVTTGSWDAPIHGTGDLGDNNISLGANAGTNLASGGNENVFLGDEAGNDVTTGDGNVLIGYSAGDKITTSNNNVVIGRSAFATASGADCSRNIAIGTQALPDVTSGQQNIAIGYGCGDVVTTGDRNIAIGDGVDFSGTGAVDEIVIGNSCVGVANNLVVGDASDFIAVDYTASSPVWTQDSDSYLKKDIEDSNFGLSFINDLRPVLFKRKTKEEFSDSVEDAPYKDRAVKEEDVINRYGFIAQEVQQAADDAGFEEFDGVSVDSKGVYRMGSGALVQPLVKAIQELSSKIDFLESRLAALE